MTLEFIDVCPSNGKQDPATRKKIRAQAMRSFRSQQRRLRENPESFSSSSGGNNDETSPELRRKMQRSRRLDTVSRSLSLVAGTVESPASVNSMFGLCGMYGDVFG